MSVHRALDLLWQNWNAVREALDPERRDELLALVEALADEGDPVVLRETAEEIAALLVELDDTHEIRAELREGERSVGQDDTAWFDLAERLAVRADPDRPTADQIAQESRERLLSVAVLDAGQLAGASLPPDPPDLIRLTRPDGEPCWPAFQFTPEGSPRPVVQEINALLGAQDDPAGVTGWWLTDNGWLGGMPADLIGVTPDERLVAAARALGTDG